MHVTNRQALMTGRSALASPVSTLLFLLVWESQPRAGLTSKSAVVHIIKVCSTAATSLLRAPPRLRPRGSKRNEIRRSPPEKLLASSEDIAEGLLDGRGRELIGAAARDTVGHVYILYFTPDGNALGVSGSEVGKAHELTGRRAQLWAVSRADQWAG